MDNPWDDKQYTSVERVRERLARQTFIWERRPEKVNPTNWDVARKVIKEGRTLESVARAYGVSRERIRQRCAKAAYYMELP